MSYKEENAAVSIIFMRIHARETEDQICTVALHTQGIQTIEISLNKTFS